MRLRLRAPTSKKISFGSGAALKVAAPAPQHWNTIKVSVLPASYLVQHSCATHEPDGLFEGEENRLTVLDESVGLVAHVLETSQGFCEHSALPGTQGVEDLGAGGKKNKL